MQSLIPGQGAQFYMPIIIINLYSAQGSENITQDSTERMNEPDHGLTCCACCLLVIGLFVFIVILLMVKPADTPAQVGRGVLKTSG